MRDDENRILTDLVPARFWRHVEIRGSFDCWPWLKTTDRTGYGRYNPRVGVRWFAHRVAWTLANRTCLPAGIKLLHTCDQPGCCNPRHHWTGDNADNSEDMVYKQRQCRGTEQHLARLTEADVIEIRRSSESQVALARRFGVWQTTISDVIRRNTWKHL